MTLYSGHGPLVVLVLGALLVSAPAPALPAGEGPGPVATTAHFAFHSDLATNLHDALITAGRARNDGGAELFHAGAEGSCFDDLPPSARLGWDLAVDFYARVLSPNDWSDRQQFLLRLDLAGLQEDPDEGARRFTGITRGFLAAATPAYEACRWGAQDAENRRWLEALTPRLAAHGEAVARRLERFYGTPLHGLPIRVDVVATAPPTGANSIYLSPAGGHLVVSSSIGEGDALEIVFHEASHTLMRHDDPIPRALAGTADELGLELPRDLWHVTLFYTTGEAVRRALEEAGEPPYTPYLYSYERFGTGAWGRHRDALETAWPAYLDGERTLGEAASDLLRATADAPR